MKQNFYICKHCGNIVAMIRDAGVPIMCCGEKMQEINVEVIRKLIEKETFAMKKKNLSHSLPDIDFLTSVSTTECTGLVPRAPLDENELEESGVVHSAPY